MAKFLTRVKLDDTIDTQFEAETGAEVLSILAELGYSRIVAPAVDVPTAPAKRQRKPRATAVIADISGGVVTAVEDITDIPQLTSLAEIADAIREYARKPGVGVAGVTKLIQEFKDVEGNKAKQVKDIAPSEFGAVSARLAVLSAL